VRMCQEVKNYYRLIEIGRLKLFCFKRTILVRWQVGFGLYRDNLDGDLVLALDLIWRSIGFIWSAKWHEGTKFLKPI
jgi:hypothetical protein